MKTWLYLPVLLLVFILPACTKTTNEVVIPNTTIVYPIDPANWGYDAPTKTYYYSIETPELKDVYETDGVVVSLGRFDQNGNPPQSYELLPQVLNDQSYFVIHNGAAVEVDIKGINGTASQKPNTRVWVKIVLIPSVNRD